jgi:hypothetical protein
MLRVIQWATGTVGREAVAAVHAHPDLQLVGALVYSADKAGRDVGEVCGIGPIGVKATASREEILAMDADCVLYCPQGEGNPDGAIAEICQILASGKNVVSTALTSLIYPKAAGADVVERLEAACRQGGVSFHGTGIEPGWAGEVLPLTMSCLFRRIDHLLVQELLDYSSYGSAMMLFDGMGFGRPHPGPLKGESSGPPAGAFGAPLMMMADALGAEIETVIARYEVKLADQPFDIRAGRIEAGTVSAKRYSFTAVIEGREALTVEHVTRLRQDQAPEWPNGRGWEIAIKGSPSMVLKSHIGVHGEDENEQGCLGTAMHAVHAVVPVCAAQPGIRTFLDLPMIMGRHALTRLR